MTNLSAEFVAWCKANAVGDEGEKATEWWRQRALQLAARLQYLEDWMAALSRRTQ